MRHFALCLAILTACAGTRSRYAAIDWYGPPQVQAGAYEAYLRGRLASVEGRHAEAIAQFRRAAALSPDEAEPRIAVAEELLRAGQVEWARAEVEALLRRWPRDPAAWLISGRVLAWRGDLRTAVRSFERAIDLSPGEETPYLLAAAAYKQLGSQDEAQKAYRRLVKRLPESVEGHYRLGHGLLASRRHASAETHLATAVGLDPDHIEARVALAEVYRATGRQGMASRMLRDAFDRSGEDSEVGKRLVTVLLEAGDRDGAMQLLATLDADWRSPRARIDIGYLYLSIRRAKEAIGTAEAVLGREPELHAARILKARGLAQLRRRGEAFALALTVPAESADHAEARAFAAEILAKDGRAREGLELINQAQELHPAATSLITMRATLHEKLGEADKARAVLEEALRLDPEDEDLRFARASLEDRLGDAERAVDIMWPLLVSDPDNVAALNFVGYSFANRRVKLEESERMLRRAAELTPDDGYVLDSLGWLLYQKGHLEEALAVLRRADRLAPDEPEILLHLGELLVRRGDAAQARDLFHRALTLEPDDRTRKRLEERVRTLEAQASPSR